jgi:hypothetical protein
VRVYGGILSKKKLERLSVRLEPEFNHQLRMAVLQRRFRSLHEVIVELLTRWLEKGHPGIESVDVRLPSTLRDEDRSVVDLLVEVSRSGNAAAIDAVKSCLSLAAAHAAHAEGVPVQSAARTRARAEGADEKGSKGRKTQRKNP